MDVLRVCFDVRRARNVYLLSIVAVDVLLEFFVMVNVM